METIEEDAMSAWREIYRSVVFPWNCDQYGHMNVRWYAHHFDDAGFGLWSVIGCSHENCGRRVQDLARSIAKSASRSRWLPL